MKNFDVQGIELSVSPETAFALIADRTQLPNWTSAFALVTRERAVMHTAYADELRSLKSLLEGRAPYA